MVHYHKHMNVFKYFVLIYALRYSVRIVDFENSLADMEKKNKGLIPPLIIANTIFAYSLVQTYALVFK